MFEGTKLKLTGAEWTVLERIGDRSGFGLVYKAENAKGERAAVKFIPKQPGAKREFLLQQPEGATNVVPILDSTETTDHYVLLMPLADKSLRKHLDDANKLPPQQEALAILQDIAEAIASIEGKIVHRDIKPANVLLLSGKWCLVDFGIAKYAEASTEAETHKFSKTPAYASPEQWRMARADSPSDIYSFGVMAYELLEGRLPFEGPDNHHFHDQHLSQDPPAMARTPEPFKSLIRTCLMKSSASRPNAKYMLEQFKRGVRPQTEGEQKLIAAKAKAIEDQSQREATESATALVREQRTQHYKDGVQILTPIIAELKRRIVEALPEVSVIPSQVPLHLAFKDVSLRMDTFNQYPHGVLQGRGQAPRFDVVATTSIGVMIPANQFSFEGRIHSLWYCDAQQEGVYRWFELGFGISALTGRKATHIPLDLDPDNPDAVLALSNVMHTYEVYRRPGPIDQAESEEFIDRWAGYFADAFLGNLTEPRTIPENPEGFHR